jgi:hypothetical protein
MRQRRWFESEAWILAPAVVLVAVIPAKAGIHFLFSLVANLSDQELDYSPHPRLALRAIRYANVRFGILPPQSGLSPG